MTTADSAALIRRVFDTVGRGDIDALAEMIADDVVEHEEFPGLEPNKEGVLRFFRYLRSAFPDLEMRAEQVIAEGDLVAVRGTLAGTHEGEFMGVPATGNGVAVPFADFFRVEEGRVAEHWGVTDTGALMEQLGATEG